MVPLFGSKVERALVKCKKKNIPLDVRYADGNAVHKCPLRRVDKEKLVMMGFAETLREDRFEISIPELRVCFETQVVHTSHDIKGCILYHCPMPQDFKDIGKREDRFFIYPRGIAALTHNDGSEKSTLLTGHDLGGGELRTKKFYIWDLSPSGFELVNSGGHRLEKGQLYEGKVKVENVETLISAEVAYLVRKPFRKQMIHIIGCRYLSPPDNLDQLVAICQRIDAL